MQMLCWLLAEQNKTFKDIKSCYLLCSRFILWIKSVLIIPDWGQFEL